MTQQFLSEFVDGGPGCGRDDCQVQIMSGSTTLAYTPPVQNKDGTISFVQNNNTVTENKRCSSCGKSWTEQKTNARGSFL